MATQRTDVSVMGAAEREARVPVAADTDFVSCSHSGSTTVPASSSSDEAGRPEAQPATVLANLGEVTDALTEGALVVITDTRVPFRLLPIEHSSGG